MRKTCRALVTLVAGLPTALVLSSCALLDVTSSSQRALQSQVDTGDVLVESQCLSCHQRTGDVIDGAPPPLTEVARRYRNARLDWELETIAEVGHYRMPRRALSAEDIAAVTAYIRSLDTGPRDATIRQGPGANAATQLD